MVRKKYPKVNLPRGIAPVDTLGYPSGVEFKTYYQGLSAEERESFAARVGTSTGYCHQLAYGAKRIELGLADAIVAASAGKLTLDDLPLTDRAKFQNTARQWDGTDRRKAAKAKAS